MNANRRLMNLQLFAVPDNINKTGDIAPVISVDFANRIGENIATLQRILGIVNMVPMAAGTLIKIYKETVTLANQVAEGEEILLSKVERVLDRTIELGLGKYLKETTAELIQQVGRDRAINRTDELLIREIRKAVKKTFFDTIAAGTGTAPAGSTLQQALANVWGALQHRYEDMDVTPIYFVSSDDVATYLGNANVSTQTLFGFTYIENFLGIGSAFVHPGLKAGQVAGTVVENLNGAYVPATGGDLADAFDLTADESGLVGVTHHPKTGNASIDTLIFCSVVFYPEYIDGVIIGKIGEAEGGEAEGDETETTYTAVENPTGNPAGQGWYELVNGEYVLTEDTTVTSGKTYYVASV